MKRSSYFLLILIVIVLGIAYWVMKPTQTQEFTYDKPDIQLSFDIGKVQKIEIEKNKQYIRFEKIKDRWKIIDPINAFADDEAMFRLMEGLAKFKLVGLISSNPQKQAMYEVDNNGINVTITSEGGAPTALVVGKVGATSGQAYIRPASSGSVYLAQGIVPALVGKSINEWRQRTVIRMEPRMMKMITVRGGGGKSVYKRDDKKWMSGGSVVPAKLMKPAVDQLSNLRAEGFIDTVAFLSSNVALHVELMADELIRMDFYPNPHASNQYLLKSSTDKNLFAVNKSSVSDIMKLAGGAEPEATEETVAAVEPKTSTTAEPKDDSYKPSANEQSSDISPEAQKVLQSILKQSRGTAFGSQEGLPNATGIEDKGELTVYTVKKGETIQTVAQKYNVSAEQVMKWNILKPGDALKPGMELYVYVVSK